MLIEERSDTLSDNPVIVRNRRASSVTSGFRALLGTSHNPDKAVNSAP
jgi:hypothetical protein